MAGSLMGRQNPLVRRLRRYTSMPVLMRAVETAEEGAVPPAGQPEAYTGLTQAVVQPRNPALPLGMVIGADIPALPPSALAQPVQRSAEAAIRAVERPAGYPPPSVAPEATPRPIETAQSPRLPDQPARPSVQHVPEPPSVPDAPVAGPPAVQRTPETPPAPAPPSSQPPAVQRTSATPAAGGPGASQPAQPEPSRSRPSFKVPEGVNPNQPIAEGSSITEGEWAMLRRTMANYQQQQARQRAEQEEIQRTPEWQAQEAERQRQEAEKQQRLDAIARRQEMARSGRLPPARVDYVAPGQPPATPPPTVQTSRDAEPLQRETIESPDEFTPPPVQDEPSQVDRPSDSPPATQVSRDIEPSTGEPPTPRPPAPTGDTGRQVHERSRPTAAAGTEIATDSPPSIQRESPTPPSAPVEGPEMARRTAERALPADTEERTPAGPADHPADAEKVGPEKPAGLGQRLLKAARSIFRSEDDEATEEESGTELMASDKPASDQPASDQPDSGELAIDKPVIDEAGMEGEARGERPPAIQREVADVALEAPELKASTDGPAEESAPPIQESRPPHISKSDQPISPAVPPPSIQRETPTASPAIGHEAGPELGATSDISDQSEIDEGAADETLILPPIDERTPTIEPTPPAETEAPSALRSEPEREPDSPSVQRTPDLGAMPPETDQSPVSMETGQEEYKGERPESPGAPPAPAERPVKPTVSAERQTMPSAPPSPPVVQRQPVPEAEADASPEIELEESSPLPRQPLPLEAMWPVEKAEKPLERPESPPVEAESATAKAVQRKPQTRDDFTDEIHKAVSDVQPGRETDSSIELVTPRRPRPQIQRRPDPRPEPPAEEQLPEMKTDATAEERSETATPPKATQVPEKPSGPYMVPTDVGNLPSDLWEYLGEEPPRPARQTAPPMEMSTTPPVQPETPPAPIPDSRPTQTTGIGRAAIQRAVDAVEGPPPSAPVAPVSPAPTPPTPLMTIERPAEPVVQRLESESTSSTEESGGEAGGEGEEGEADAEQIRKLARMVIGHVKRELNREWERTRGIY